MALSEMLECDTSYPLSLSTLKFALKERRFFLLFPPIIRSFVSGVVFMKKVELSLPLVCPSFFHDVSPPS